MVEKQKEFKEHLKPGGVYRKAELAQWSSSVDRYLRLLIKDGTLQRLWRGVYFFPKETVFGVAPPEDSQLIRAFLGTDDFLVHSFNAYNSLGVGATQLYNEQFVYNHKRKGSFLLAGKTFHFVRTLFPKALSEEFLLVDLINNLDRLAEDREIILNKAFHRARTMDQNRLKAAICTFGNHQCKHLFAQLLG